MIEDWETFQQRFYRDGPDEPNTPQLQTAERAYRDAFLAAAREAANWNEPDDAKLRKAWNERRYARRRAEESIDGAFVQYRPGHVVPASRERGRVHGFEFVAQCFDELKKAGVPTERIRPQVIVPWVEHVAQWAERRIEPNRIHIPPRPDDFLTERQRRMLEKVIHPDPKQARAILERLADVTREFLDWLWPGRIPLGKLTLLAGDPGLGKSFVTLDIASRVSCGAAWPDMPLFKQTPGGVILLNAEDDLADTIAPRLDKMKADDTRIFAIQGIAGRDPKDNTEWQRSFSLETDLPRLEEVLIENPDTRLVVIDPISACTGGVDSHKNSDVRGLLAPLANLASQYHIRVLSVTHLSKAIYRSMGSLAFAAAARAVWTICKAPNDPQRRLFLPAKLNLAQDPDGLAYRIEDGRVLWEPDPVKMHADDVFAEEAKSANGRGNRGSERREATDFIREQLAGGPKPASDLIELGEQYGFSERTLRRAYKQIGMPAKKESFDGPWMWCLAEPSGHEAANSPRPFELAAWEQLAAWEPKPHPSGQLNTKKPKGSVICCRESVFLPCFYQAANSSQAANKKGRGHLADWQWCWHFVLNDRAVSPNDLAVWQRGFEFFHTVVGDICVIKE